MSDWAIRRLLAGDEPWVRWLALEGPSFETGDGEDTPHVPLSPEAAAEMLGDERTWFLAAFPRTPSAEEPVGFLLAHELLRRHGAPRMALLYEVSVRRDHRRRGIGRELLRSFASLARTRGVRRAILGTGRTNEAAKGLYRSSGWRCDEHTALFHLDLD